MPIFVSHQPSVQLMAQAGYTAGAGQFMQQQREMAQRERMQMRGLEAEALAQQRALDHDSMRMRFNAFSRHLTNKQAEAFRGAWEERRLEMEQAEAKARLAHEKEQGRLDRLLRKQLADDASRNQAEADMVKGFRAKRIEIEDRIRDKIESGYEFDDKNRALWKEYGELATATGKQKTVNGVVKEQTLLQRLFEIDESSLQIQDEDIKKGYRFETVDGKDGRKRRVREEFDRETGQWKFGSEEVLIPADEEAKREAARYDDKMLSELTANMVKQLVGELDEDGDGVTEAQIIRAQEIVNKLYMNAKKARSGDIDDDNKGGGEGETRNETKEAPKKAPKKAPKEAPKEAPKKAPKEVPKEVPQAGKGKSRTEEGPHVVTSLEDGVLVFRDKVTGELIPDYKVAEIKEEDERRVAKMKEEEATKKRLRNQSYLDSFHSL